MPLAVTIHEGPNPKGHLRPLTAPWACIKASGPPLLMWSIILLQSLSLLIPTMMTPSWKFQIESSWRPTFASRKVLTLPLGICSEEVDSFLSHVRDCSPAWLYIRLSLPKIRGEREEGPIHLVLVHVSCCWYIVYASCDFRNENENTIKVLDICVPLCSHRLCVLFLDFIRRFVQVLFSWKLILS